MISFTLSAVELGLKEFGSFKGDQSNPSRSPSSPHPDTSTTEQKSLMEASIAGEATPSSPATQEPSHKQSFLICLRHLFAFLLFFQDGTTRFNAGAQSPTLTPFLNTFGEREIEQRPSAAKDKSGEIF